MWVRDPPLIPNHSWGYGESDIWRITKSKYAIDYEIKISRGDFFADFKKKKTFLLKAGGHHYGPHRMFYVCPSDLIKEDEVPEYAGLMYIHENNGIFTLEKIKNAPKFKKHQNVNERYIERILKTVAKRYMYGKIKELGKDFEL